MIRRMLGDDGQPAKPRYRLARMSRLNRRRTVGGEDTWAALDEMRSTKYQGDDQSVGIRDVMEL